MSLHTKKGSRADAALGTLNLICCVALAGTTAMIALMAAVPSHKPAPAVRSVIWIDAEQAPRVALNSMMPALVHTESRGNRMALSPKGAAGAYQIMPATARKPGFGVTPLRWWDGKDPRTAPQHEQERFANDYLNAVQSEHGGNKVLAAAAYNAGPGLVASMMKQAKGNVHRAVRLLPTETRSYVRKVAGYQIASLPPARVSVFDVLERSR